MEGLDAWQYLLIALLFVWGGFVRSGLGFGGAVLTDNRVCRAEKRRYWREKLPPTGICCGRKNSLPSPPTATSPAL